MEQANTKPPHNHGQICAKCGWAFYGHMCDCVAKAKINGIALDAINPAYYKSGEVECIIAMKEATKNLLGIDAICTGNIIKYLWRWKNKNGIEDLKKAKWYLDHLIQQNEKLEANK